MTAREPIHWVWREVIQLHATSHRHRRIVQLRCGAGLKRRTTRGMRPRPLSTCIDHVTCEACLRGAARDSIALLKGARLA